jgi:hypothetical protein
MYKLCRHIRISGGRCRCAALPNQNFCHYHLTQRKSVAITATPVAAQGVSMATPLELPPIEDRFSVQVAIGRILSALASGSIDQRNAGLFLYGIQIATANLPRETGVLTPSSSVRRVVLTRQDEQVAEAETVFEEDDTKGHKKSCDCDACNRSETDDPHHPSCGCGECHYFAEEETNAEEGESAPEGNKEAVGPGKVAS